jgi:hypothetical protein
MATVVLDRSEQQYVVPRRCLKRAGRCWVVRDEEYIRSMISNRLGGTAQIMLLVKAALGSSMLGASGASGAATGVVATPVSDRALLTELFMRCGGAGWNNRTNWCEDSKPLNEWYGVTTADAPNGSGSGASGDASGAVGTTVTVVTGLDLFRNGLSGGTCTLI